jgi:hypothetical protein
VIPDFQKLLDAHDWDFMSSEGTRYDRGLASQKKLLYLCQQQPELFRLYNRAESRHIAGFCTTTNKFQTSPGNSAENETQKPTNPQTHSIPTTMKEVFQLFFDICIKPLVEAINNHSVGAPASPHARLRPRRSNRRLPRSPPNRPKLPSPPLLRLLSRKSRPSPTSR